MAGAVLVAGLAAGCAQAPGAAATVNGSTISDTDVQEVVLDVRAYLESEIPPSQALVELIRAPELLEIAAGHGIAVSDSEVYDALALVGVTDAELSEPTLLVLRSSLVIQSANADPQGASIAEELGERMDSLDVRVSPRYGQWESPGHLAPVVPGWLYSSDQTA